MVRDELILGDQLIEKRGRDQEQGERAPRHRQGGQDVEHGLAVPDPHGPQESPMQTDLEECPRLREAQAHETLAAEGSALARYAVDCISRGQHLDQRFASEFVRPFAPR